MIRRAREYLDAEGMPGLEMLRSVVAEHLSGLERLTKLQRYYRGQTAILSCAGRRACPTTAWPTPSRATSWR